jgi:glucose-1-phosphate adenylyltransferase
MRITSFVEKPMEPPSNQANMGVYVFNEQVLDRALWDDHIKIDSDHDFGKDILPRLVAEGLRMYAYPFQGYWVDVGTVNSYWRSHMDLLVKPSPIDLNDRKWIVHTRTEERPPVWLAKGARIEDSMVADGCEIYPGACVGRSVLSPGVIVREGAVVRESIILTDSVIQSNAKIERAILDKKTWIGPDAIVGSIAQDENIRIPMIGKNSRVAASMVVEPGAVIGPDVIELDYLDIKLVRSQDFVQTKRLPYEI